ncbi:MAG: diguanylate cyclase [Pseudomonadota bacterium]
MGCEFESGVSPRASHGQLDLSNWNWREQGSLTLDGEWLFYPNKLLTPAEIASTSESSRTGTADQRPSSPITLKVPAAWNRAQADGNAMSAIGFGTYALRITLPDNAPPLALGKVDTGTAHKVFIDNDLVHTAGQVGTRREDTIAGFNRNYAILPDSDDSVRWIVVQVANFHYRTGGIWEPVTLGVRDSVYQAADASLAYAIFLAGGIGVIGLYHIGLYSQRREDTSPLFFALLCFAICLRVLSIDDRYLQQLLPSLSFAGLLRVEFISFLLAPPAFAGFLRSAMPGCFSGTMLRWIAGLGLLATAFVLVTPPLMFSRWLYVYELYLVLTCGYGLVVFSRAVKARLLVARGFLLGFGILVAAIINDILITLGVQLVPVFLVGAGLFCFIVIQSYAISLRSAQAFESIKDLTRELESYSADLEKMVEERTQELESANVELERLVVMDGLTKIANRRKFDETLRREWTAHRRRKGSLSVVLADIDDFKRYNDRYGHIKGDEALRFVAGAIAGSLSRPTDLAARYGGEEFVVLLPDTPLEGAIDVAERLRGAVSDLHIAHEDSRRGELSLSLGVASLIPGDDSNGATLVQLADDALYQAKAKGRNRVVTSA